MSRRTSCLPLLSVLALIVAACADSRVPTGPVPGERPSLTQTPGEHATKKLFTDYVSMGSSIAAGFMSGGINQTTQLLAYPVLLANRAGAKFDVPLLALPGCPAPFTAPITFPVGTPPCAGRSNDVYPPQTNNVAVSGVTVAEALTFPAGGEGQLQLLMLGNITQVDAMLAAKPTFVTVQLGDNDVFGAALTGVVGPAAPGADSVLTRLSSFQSSYSQIVAALQSDKKLDGAALIGVTDPILAAPVLQPGAFFYLARDPATGLFLGKPVNVNCSPVTALGQPNPLGANLVSYLMFATASFPEINCDPSAYPIGDPRRGVYLLDALEQLAIRTRVQQFNALIAQAAAANDWAYYDPNVTITAALLTRTSGRTNLIRKCQDLATASSAAQFQAAVLNTCPVTGPTGAPNLFGSLISFDGVHPSAEGQVLLANTLAAIINAKYGTTLATF